MAQVCDQRERNWRAGATADKSREDQQPAGVLEEAARSCAALWYRESDGGYDGLGRQARCARRQRRARRGQLVRASTEELACSRVQSAVQARSAVDRGGCAGLFGAARGGRRMWMWMWMRTECSGSAP